MRFLPWFCYPLPDAASGIQAHLVNIHCCEFPPHVLFFSFTYSFDQIVCGLNKINVSSPLFLGNTIPVHMRLRPFI